MPLGEFNVSICGFRLTKNKFISKPDFIEVFNKAQIINPVKNN